MLSIARMSRGSGEYYLGLAADDYYLAGGEPPGSWYGQGSLDLGLSGRVTTTPFRRLFRGLSPEGKALVQNAYAKNHDRSFRPGWDLTFSAPKHVSLLWATTDAETRRSIQRLHEQAVKDALDYLESKAAFTRAGKGGKSLEPAQLVLALFEHGTSRALDPNLHTHALAFNIGVREDGTTATIVSRSLYRHKMAAGALYRLSLAHALKHQLGIAVEPTDKSFRIPWIKDELTAAFSKRRTEILKALGDRFPHSAKAQAVAALDTRSSKNHDVPRSELFARWKSEAKKLGFEPKWVPNFKHTPAKEREIRATFQRVVSELTQANSHVREPRLVQHMASAALPLGLDVPTLHSSLETLLHQPPVQILAERAGERIVSTTAVLAEEQKLLGHLEPLARGGPKVSTTNQQRALNGTLLERAVDRTKTAAQALLPAKLRELPALKKHLAPRRKLNAEQQQAFQHLTSNDSRLRIVTGLAGTGKTSLLKACHKAWTKQGLKVHGTSLAGVAARNLAKETGIHSDTLRATLKALYPETKDTLKHHATQMFRAARGKKTYALPRLRLTSRSILVVDEAGMVSNRDLERLAAKCAQSQATLVLVGDEHQLQAIERGGALQALKKRLGAPHLVSCERQALQPTDSLGEPDWQRKATAEFAHGKAQEALERYAKRGFITVAKTKREATQALIQDWTRDGGIKTPREQLVLVATRQDASRINKLCQQERQVAGVVSRFQTAKVGGTRIFTGDRVLFGQRNRALGLENGDFATVTRIEMISRKLHVRLDDHRQLTLPLSKCKNLELGYAATSHKVQGLTLDKAKVLLGGSMQDRELTYVQASRARHETRFYLSQSEAGKELARIKEVSAVSRQKLLATDVSHSHSR